MTHLYVPMQVRKVSELHAGDHIKWKRLAGYDHHAIVESVDDKGKIHVIEYGSGNRGSSFGKAVIRKSEVSDVAGMYKCVYDQCDDAEIVLHRANEKLGERRYNPFSNNCEHFATGCEVGKEHGSQVVPFIIRTLICVFMSACAGLATVICRSAFEKAVVASLVCFTIEVCLLWYHFCKTQKICKAAIQRAKDQDMVLRCKEDEINERNEALFEFSGATIATLFVVVLMHALVISRIATERKSVVTFTAFSALISNIVGRVLGGVYKRWRITNNIITKEEKIVVVIIEIVGRIMIGAVVGGILLLLYWMYILV